MNIVNLTPHTVVLRDVNGVDHSFVSQGIARVSQTAGQPFALAGVPVPCFTAPVFGAIEGLPDPVVDTILICSLVVCNALKGSRADVFQPGTGPNDGAIREDGKIVAVTRLNQAQ